MSKKVQVLNWLVCDNVHTDPATGKQTILGVFHSIRVRQLPAQHPGMVWYLTLTGLTAGKHSIEIFWGVPMEEDRSIIKGEVESAGPDQRVNLIQGIQQLPITKTGHHSITIKVDGVEALFTTLEIGNA